MIQMPKADSAETARTTDLSEHGIAAILESRIASGVYGPGARIPSERMLALELGVSRRFVRMAFALLVDRGLMEKSHYRRPFVSLTGDGKPVYPASGNGSSVAAPATNQTITAILPSHPTFPGGLALVAGIHKVLAYSGSPYRLTYIDTFHKDRSEVLKIERGAVEALAESGSTGVIWWSYSDDVQVAETVRQNADIPIVFIDRHPNSLDCDFVGIDDVESSRAAVEYLFDLDHTRVAHLMDPGNYSTILERAEGYRQAHVDRHVPYSDELVFHLGWSENRIQLAFEKLYALPNPPTALFTSNDFIAYEFINYAESQGLSIPDDLSVVGHGNIDRYSAREFLTSVDQPFELVGRAAAKLLLKRIENRGSGTGGAQSYQHMIMPAMLIDRRSCARLGG